MKFLQISSFLVTLFVNLRKSLVPICRFKIPYYCRIQFRYGSVWGPKRGYTGNVAPHNEVSLDSGTFIDRIELWSGTVLDSVTFYSENGKLCFYRSDTVNSNTVKSKFNFIQIFCHIMFPRTLIILCLKCTVNSNSTYFEGKPC